MVNSTALQLLNQHLDEIVTIGNKQYPREKVARVYAKLNPPIPQGNFYEGQRVRGRITQDNVFDPGTVSFQTYYPETGWSHNSPTEKGIQSNMPRPTRELIQMNKAFQDLRDSPQGKVVYANTPISSHRADAYEKVGFSPEVRGIQTLDNRRFQNLPAVKEMYDVVPGMVPRERQQLTSRGGGSYDNPFYDQLREEAEMNRIQAAEIANGGRFVNYGAEYGVSDQYTGSSYSTIEQVERAIASPGHEITPEQAAQLRSYFV